MLFDQKPALNFIINGLAVIGFAMAILRRHVYGIALGIMGVVAVALVYLTRDSLPVIDLLWNPRVLPWLYLVRYLLMMVGVVEVGSVRGQPGAQPAGSHRRRASGVNSIWMAVAGLTVLIIFGWVYQVLPGGNRVAAADGDQGVRVGTVPRSHRVRELGPGATAGRATTSPATRTARSTPSTTT